MNKKTIIGLFFVLLGALFILVLAVYFVQEHKENLEQEIYQDEVHLMQKNLASMIEEKKKSTTAIALTLASNDALQELFVDKKKLDDKLNSLIFAFRKHTNYKNIWIHILDKEGNTLYRSWTKKNDIALDANRKDLAYVMKNKVILSDVSVDSFTLSIKSIVPLYNKDYEFIGMVAVISHFNSIAKSLKKVGIDSVVAVTEQASAAIKYPFTEMYIQNCYIANFDAPQALQAYLKNNNVKQFCQTATKITDGYIIVNYPLKDYDGKTVAYYIMFKKISAVSKTGLDYFVFRWSMFAIIALMALAGTINIFYYFVLKKQKVYYKNILDNSNNIILINDRKCVVDANKTFFKYFTKYKSIKEFREENSCICNFFVDEEGYLNKGEKPYGWMDIVLENPQKTHKVKMKIEDKIYYFMVYISLISREKNHYSVIFANITEQELYKKELEKLSFYDALTNAGNRRKFEEKLSSEMARSCRYKDPLSLILCDIDHFKEVNDTHGHTVGDKVLREYTQLVNSLLRDVDELFRVGGEEFVIIAPHTTKESAALLAEKLRKAIEDYKKIVPITMSFGVTEFKVCEDEESFYNRADQALYEAKKSGRNRVVVK
ncbi:MAG: diguanylate cyclase [Epsilonproteobacteria bacterium]|nr:diguanylate cyclase [Campylobacterota bacterium]